MPCSSVSHSVTVVAFMVRTTCNAGRPRQLPAPQRRLRDDPRGVASLVAFKRRQEAVAAAAATRAAAGGRFPPHQPRRPQVNTLVRTVEIAYWGYTYMLGLHIDYLASWEVQCAPVSM